MGTALSAICCCFSALIHRVGGFGSDCCMRTPTPISPSLSPSALTLPSPLHYSCLLTLLLLLIRSAFSQGNPPKRRVICSSFGLESLSSLNSQMKIKISGPGSMHFERIKLSFFYVRTVLARFPASSLSRKSFSSPFRLLSPLLPREFLKKKKEGKNLSPTESGLRRRAGNTHSTTCRES